MTTLVDRTLARDTGQGSTLDLHYVEGAGPGAPVLLQHGLCGSASQAAEVFPGDAGARLLTLECRGHGQSPAGPLEALSMATFADDVHTLMNLASPAALIVGGISMGAAIALRLAVRFPQRVRALILARPAWSCQPAPPNMQANLEVGQLLAQWPPAEARRRFLAGATAQDLAREAPDNLASLTGFFERTPLEVTRALLCRLPVDGPGVSEEELARLRIPVLVIGHALDSIHPIGMARDLAAMLPAAEFVQVTPKASDRAAYLRDMQSALRAFIQRNPAP